MQFEMATTKKPTARPTQKPRNSSPKPAESEGRKVSRFTRVGNDAKAAAQRKLLLDTLKQNGWNLTATAEALEMSALTNVIRALQELAPDEYEAARRDGRISPGNRRD